VLEVAVRIRLMQRGAIGACRTGAPNGGVRANASAAGS